MNNKNERRIRFSAVKFRRLPMPEKLAYLRAAFSALGNGLQVLERRRSAPRTPAPAVEAGAPEPSGTLPPVLSIARLLSRADFDRLSIEQKLAYLSTAFRELQQAERKLRGLPRVAAPRRPSRADKPVKVHS